MAAHVGGEAMTGRQFREQRVLVPKPVMTLLETLAQHDGVAPAQWVQRVFEAGFPWLEGEARRRSAAVPEAKDWEL